MPYKITSAQNKRIEKLGEDSSDILNKRKRIEKLLHSVRSQSALQQSKQGSQQKIKIKKLSSSTSRLSRQRHSVRELDSSKIMEMIKRKELDGRIIIKNYKD